MELADPVVVAHGERELFELTGHLFAAADDVACAAHSMRTWAAHHTPETLGAMRGAIAAGKRVRKLFRPAMLLEPASAAMIKGLAGVGAEVRISTAELPETILLDRRLAIIAGPASAGGSDFSIVRAPDVVAGLEALYDTAWRSARPLAAADGSLAALRAVTPRILDALSAGWTDETAARTLGMSVRTYRRRVAELMAALQADSRFQAGVRARELDLA